MIATILIIEDDAAILRGLTDYFRKSGFGVRTATDGAQGLLSARNGDADLILLDVMLPKLNGFEICRAIRAEGRDLPIVMLTAKGQEDDIVRGLEVGADDYVTKPFSVRELHARVQAFLRRRGKGGSGAVQEFGDCRMDRTSHRLFKEDVEIVLTTKEYRLLEFFLERPGRALTRDMIINGVWGSDVIVTTRSVDRCITTLRGKIERDAHAPAHIQTIRDVGYRFEPDGRRA
jgi:DNA-binding response OmpR family regulator